MSLEIQILDRTKHNAAVPCSDFTVRQQDAA
jgi:hypothetical protein